MKKNLGQIDKIIRFLLGITGGLLVYFKVFDEVASWVILTLAAILLLTSLVSFCPLYGILGINSCRPRR